MRVKVSSGKARNNKPLDKRRAKWEKMRLQPDIYRCVLCKRFHALQFCRKFLNMTAEKRERVVEDNHYCTNCLARSHDLRACSSMHSCRKCTSMLHHTLLHRRSQHSQKLREITTRELRQRRRSRSRKSSAIKSRGKEATAFDRVHKIAVQPAKSQQPVQQKALTATPEARVIVEAIRSLANVLCASEKASSVA